MAAARAGKVSHEEFLRLLAGTQVFIPSRQEVQADGAGLAPLVLERDKTPFVAVFTSLPRLQTLGGQVPFCLEMVTSALLPRLPPGYGLAVNPGHALSLEIAPFGVQNIIQSIIGNENSIGNAA